MNLKELSKHLNLSQTTVSRALNGYPEVSEATRQRVHEAAIKFRYRPNSRARTLATGRSMSIGHVIPMSRHNELGNVIFADFIAGAGLVYAEHGYTMTLSIVNDENELDAYRAFAERGAVDGLLVQSPARRDRRIAFLSELGIPFILHGRSAEITQPYAWVDVDNEGAIRRATELLISLGHRRIALINGNERLDFAVSRKQGFLTGLAGAGLPMDPALLRSGEMSEPNGYRAAVQLLSGKDAPTAFVASSIVIALGIKRAAQDKGLVVGHDVSIVCFDDDISYLPNRGEMPSFTAVRSSARAAGARCATLLLEQIKSPDMAPPEELWETELVIGQSTGPGPFAATVSA